MRNLKRVLALVMALVMALSLMVMGVSAASYPDANQIDANYAEAIEVLSSIGVFRGQGADNGSAAFAPKAILTRAEASTLVYRLITGDVTDAKKDLYDYSSFDDVKEGAWYTGYVTYAANGGYVVGDGNGKFRPDDQVTGVQVLTIMLRAIGYGQNGEYVGAAWKDNVLTDAHELGLLKGIVTNDLDKGASRELVAQLLFNAITTPKMVTYSALLGYRIDRDATTLGDKVFALTKTDAGNGDWGRPYDYKWVLNAGTKSEKTLYTAWETPLAVYTEATKNCDIYADTGLKKNAELDVYTNSNTADGTYKITDTKTTAAMTAQGRLTEVYSECVVNIDTYLAEVTKVTAEKTDSRGHVTPAYIEVGIYGLDESKYEPEYETEDFAKGDKVLVTVLDGVVMTVEDAPYEVNALTKIAGNTKTINDIQDVMGLDKADVTVNHTAVYAPQAMTLGATYGFYYDTYGNVIGAVVLGTNYVVLDKLYIEHDKGVDTAYGTVYFFDGENDSDVVIKKVVSDTVADFEVTSAKNTEYYYTVYAYNEKDGVYTLDNSKFNTSEYVEYRAGSKYMMDWDNGEKLQLSKNSQILLQTSPSPNGKFTAYTGYADLPSFESDDDYYVQYTLDALGYVDMLYAYAYEFSSRTVFVYDTKPSYSWIDDAGNKIATLNVLELVDGEMKDTTVDVYYDLVDEDEAWGGDIDHIGLYEITEGEDGIWYAIDQYYAYTIEKVTNDGKRVLINDYYEDLDDAQIVKYVGTWVCGDYDLKWTTKDLIADGDAFGYVQYDEDGNVVAVYDLFVTAPVFVDEEMTKDIEYYGRDFKSITVELAEYEKIDSAAMIGELSTFRGDHNDRPQQPQLTITYYNGTNEIGDKLDAKGTKVTHAVISYTGDVTGPVVIKTGIQDAYTNAKLVDGTYNFTADKQSAKVEYAKQGNKDGVITVKDDNDTVTVANLKALLEAKALGTNFQSIKIYNTNAAEVATGNLANDMYVQVTAWDGKTTAIYQIVVEASR
ncbi:MAG: S-layer homology domain-containing protein [Oscillospiraceae bacterium]